MFSQSSHFTPFLVIFCIYFVFFRVKFGKMVCVYPIFYQFGANSEKCHMFWDIFRLVFKFFDENVRNSHFLVHLDDLQLILFES